MTEIKEHFLFLFPEFTMEGAHVPRQLILEFPQILKNTRTSLNRELIFCHVYRFTRNHTDEFSVHGKKFNLWKLSFYSCFTSCNINVPLVTQKYCQYHKGFNLEYAICNNSNLSIVDISLVSDDLFIDMQF